MKNKMIIKVLIAVLCAVLLIATVAVAVILDSRSAEPILGIFQTEPTTSEEVDEPVNGDDESAADQEKPSENGEEPTEKSETPTEKNEEPTQETEDSTQPTEAPIAPPENLPPSVDIPAEEDPETGEQSISFPCQVPGYGLVIEKIAPYSGMFVEDGSNVSLQNVAMLLVENNGDFPIEYMQISVAYGQETLLFDISALPVGEKLVVQEKTGKGITEDMATSATALVVQRADMEMSKDQVAVIDNGDNTMTIRNLTNETIPTVRVFYKYYMEEEGLFVGGIAFTVRISRLGAGASVTVQPSHYTSDTSRIVMVLTYDSEV